MVGAGYYIIFLDRLFYPKAILELKSLNCFYMHGNSISEKTEVDKLTNLKELRTLTLHGNPVQKQPNFYEYVLVKLPTLRNFNFSAISKSEKQKSVMELERLKR
jgi:hypothetical protein